MCCIRNYKYKQVIVVRRDVSMGRGKLAAQVAHAAVSTFYKTLIEKPEYAYEWLREGQPKIVVKVSNLDELMKVKKKADGLGIINELIRDAGYTQVEPGTITCLGIGPAPVDLIDKVTGDLKLL